jgi:hydroxyacylglutathione hydrolase
MSSPHPIPAFHLLQNYLWLLENDDEAWVVDPGDASTVNEALKERGRQLKGILLTHHHFDHVDGAKALRDQHSAPIYGPANSPFKHIDHALEEGMCLDVFDRSYQIMSTPGHTLDHIAYYSAATNNHKPWLFCGDVLFAGGCGRVFEGDAKMMWETLSRLARLPDETEIYCGHEYTVDNLHFAAHVERENTVVRQRLAEEIKKRANGIPTLPSLMSLERQTNPFLRAHDKKLRKSLGHGADSSIDDISVFADLRAKKDAYAPPPSQTP